MEIELLKLPQAERYHLLTSLIVPRPIAWITSQSAAGVTNAAPFSFFNLFGSKPPLVVLSIGNRPGTDDPKDTVKNIKATEEFVINTVSFGQTDKMVASSSPLPETECELATYGIETQTSAVVAPPRIAGSAAHFECRLHSINEIGQNRLIIAKIVHLHVRDDLFDADSKRIDPTALDAVGRMGSPDDYIRCDAPFTRPRP